MSENPRLLPWPGPAGQRSYLVTDGGGRSRLSRLADQLEEAQLQAGDILLGHAADMLKDVDVNPWELRYLSACLHEALRDALRVAESRGDRLPVPEDDDTDNNGTSPHAEEAAS
ncbi:hypothetical protein AB0465_19560 [Streptomyces griseoviridis]|uniref:Uncharacterized protein n=1 Tax=Streptomyces griseoviridis TaxID=45398 RepID=A0A3Q9KSY4_STRGD|nr:hypothetical protein [Streptomyces griseoviridis]AZS85383.1 hypothetical protein ELQ87_14550 [Streptomyces griseoviridis]QCN87764.1 hypothetical protein DDJ31_24745 [Streptomyces griseoviridis]